jgi:UDP-N-acetylmuramate--alanine ligase
MTRAGRAPYWQGSGADVPAAVAADARAGDVIITIGAGDITKAGPALLALLRAT